MNNCTINNLLNRDGTSSHMEGPAMATRNKLIVPGSQEAVNVKRQLKKMGLLVERLLNA